MIYRSIRINSNSTEFLKFVKKDIDVNIERSILFFPISRRDVKARWRLVDSNSLHGYSLGTPRRWK